MTYRELLQQEYPEWEERMIQSAIHCACPCDYGYEPDNGDCEAEGIGCDNSIAEKCWGREIPERPGRVQETAIRPDAQEELAELRAELARVKRERDAEVADIGRIFGRIEQICTEAFEDGADTDDKLAKLCGAFCANSGRMCYEEGENHECRNFRWNGLKKEET